MPLADDMRPTSLDGVIGQEHLTHEGAPVAQMVEFRDPRNVILYGPPGCGKTTMARIVAEASAMPLVLLNAVSASVKDIKAAAGDGSALVYLDEIQYFNKKQQQSLLPYIESGDIVLIASTTENPYHGIYDALLSRCLVLEVKRVATGALAEYLKKHARTADDPIFGTPDDVLDHVAHIASGDVRRAWVLLEALINARPFGHVLTPEDVDAITPTQVMGAFDTAGDAHYAYISALQKSIRGSDPDAAVFWLAKLLEGGDIVSPCRRLPAICCEDIGLANPQAIQHTMACIEAAERLGLPEAYKPLTQAVVYLALCPKSASNEPAWMGAQKDIRNGMGATVPKHLSSSCHPAYVWPQDKPGHWVEQQYLPDDLVGKTYYAPSDNEVEQGACAYWQSVRDAVRKMRKE